MMRFIERIHDLLKDVPEDMPWDLEERLAEHPEALIIDVREPDEFAYCHIEGSLNIPRGILESAAEWNFDETEPELVRARENGDRDVVVVCRSGHRSLLSAWSLQVLDYPRVLSLKTGLRGWNDFDQPMVNAAGEAVDPDEIDAFFTSKLREDQRQPGG